MVKLNKIYTKTGDAGTTGLGSGERVAKDAARIEAYGTVDETNAAIGMVRIHLGGGHPGLDAEAHVAAGPDHVRRAPDVHVSTAAVGELEAVVASAGLPVRARLPDDARLSEAMALDKKVSGARIRFVLPTRLGEVQLRDDLEPGAVSAAWASIRA